MVFGINEPRKTQKPKKASKDLTSCTRTVTLAQAQVVKPQRVLAPEISDSFPRQLSLSNLLEFGPVGA